MNGLCLTIRQTDAIVHRAFLQVPTTRCISDTVSPESIPVAYVQLQIEHQAMLSSARFQARRVECGQVAEHLFILLSRLGGPTRATILKAWEQVSM